MVWFRYQLVCEQWIHYTSVHWSILCTTYQESVKETLHLTRKAMYSLLLTSLFPPFLQSIPVCLTYLPTSDHPQIRLNGCDYDYDLNFTASIIEDWRCRKSDDLVLLSLDIIGYDHDLTIYMTFHKAMGRVTMIVSSMFPSYQLKKSSSHPQGRGIRGIGFHKSCHYKVKVGSHGSPKRSNVWTILLSWQKYTLERRYFYGRRDAHTMSSTRRVISLLEQLRSER